MYLFKSHHLTFFDNQMKSSTTFLVFNIVLAFMLIAPLLNMASPSVDEAPHPYHVSYTEINTTDSSITIALEVFTDDLQLAVKQAYQPEKYFLGADSISAEGQKLTRDYFSSVFQIVVNGKPLNDIVFFEIESNPDRTTIYVEFKNTVAIKSLAIKNSVLINVFSDQENIIEAKNQNNTEKALLHKGKEIATFTYN